ncbi:MAG: carboxypeptidase M32 [Erysipelotrichaceae bacterium]
MNKLMQQYQQEMFKISAYNLALATVSIDNETIAPKRGAGYRNKRLAFLSGEAYSLQTSPAMFDLLNEMLLSEQIDEQTKKIVSWQLNDLNKIKLIPKDLYVYYDNLCSDSQLNWQKARAENDYSIFKPYLKEVINTAKKILQCRQGKLSGYDIFLDDYETSMDREKYDRFFDLIKEKIVPVINQIGQTEQIDDSFAYQYYPIEKQKILMEKILQYIGFDFDSGLLMESEHPFTDSISRFDTRITTHYYPNNLFSSIFSVIHEAGHANYNYSVRDDLAETYCFNNMTSGMHESQSRLYENYLGRNYHFWDNLFPVVKDLFADQLADIDQNQFVRAMNKSIPSLIRTESDELTYPLHILIRYELEKGIFNDEISVDDLPYLWNKKYREYLNVEVKNDNEGILQDVHWSGGGFGYFPTYALGSGYAAQFVDKMSADIDIEKCLADNQFGLIKAWLKENIGQYGGLNSPTDQMIIATSKPFDPNYYVDYLINKYSKLYNL